MKQGVDFQIVVPSRHRVFNMETIMALLPTAIVTVEESEMKDYAHSVPKEQLLPHPKLEGLPLIHNWLLDEIKTPTLIRIDDDFKGVIRLVGRGRRTIKDPDDILTILNNATRVATDLDVGVFCFSRTPNTTIVRPEEKPFLPAGPVASAFGVRGNARHRPFDHTLHGRADIDFTLSTLLLDRCVLQDTRFYFDFGPIGYGTGGSAGLITKQKYTNVTRLLARRWGKALNQKSQAILGKRQAVPLRLQVSRTNTRAQR